MAFRGEIHSIGTSGKFAFVTCYKNKAGAEENMYLPQKAFTGEFETLQQGDLVCFDDYTGNSGKSPTVQRCRLLPKNLRSDSSSKDLGPRMPGAGPGSVGSRPSANDPWARGQAGGTNRNPHKEQNPLAPSKWGAAHDKEDKEGSWVGGFYIYHGKKTGNEPPPGPKGVPSKEMLLALARGQTDVDKVKDELLKKESREAGESGIRRSRSRSRGRQEKRESPPKKQGAIEDGDTAAAAALACRDFDEAQLRFPALMHVALHIPGSPGEAAFREHWAPGSQHHASLKTFLAVVWNRRTKPNAK